MKKFSKIIAMGSMISILASCGVVGKTDNQSTTSNNLGIPELVVEELAQEPETETTAEKDKVLADSIENEDQAEVTQENEDAHDDTDHTESVDEPENRGNVSDSNEIEDLTSVLEKIAGEYEYTSDEGTGKLVIKKSVDDSYDFEDYAPGTPYRFLANSSNIVKVEDNQILIKYPAKVYEDGTVIFEYYTLEYNADTIEVLYQASETDSLEKLYSATRIN